jgi:hypothetical protein
MKKSASWKTCYVAGPIANGCEPFSPTEAPRKSTFFPVLTFLSESAATKNQANNPYTVGLTLEQFNQHNQHHGAYLRFDSYQPDQDRYASSMPADWPGLECRQRIGERRRETPPCYVDVVLLPLGRLLHLDAVYPPGVIARDPDDHEF